LQDVGKIVSPSLVPGYLQGLYIIAIVVESVQDHIKFLVGIANWYTVAVVVVSFPNYPSHLYVPVRESLPGYLFWSLGDD
jgi:hypothetical protein